ncbi:hypothetical protein NC652_036627 [Populus alba x Populus x berolinensis]|nr:hypothetical protein NC652_036627 [Populus alba x Populus x berolinensis]
MPLAVTTYVARFNKFHGVYENLIELVLLGWANLFLSQSKSYCCINESTPNIYRTKKKQDKYVCRYNKVKNLSAW